MREDGPNVWIATCARCLACSPFWRGTKEDAEAQASAAGWKPRPPPCYPGAWVCPACPAEYTVTVPRRGKRWR